MKKNLWLCCSLFILFAACKKESINNNNDEGNAPATFTPAYVPPSQPGILQVSQSSVTIKAGSSVTLAVAVFNSDGSDMATQPAFFWSSDHSNIASVNNGQITGVAEGAAIVSVTDGSHGIEYVAVNVVNDTTTIPTAASNITFTRPVLVLAKGESANISYTVKNQSAQSVQIMPAFVSGNGISISGNAVKAGNATGNFTIIAANGTDTLSGALQVIVYDPQNPGQDTAIEITRLVNFPINFSKPGLSSAPFRIEVTKTFMTGNNTLGVQKIQASPSSVTVYNTDVVTLNGNGCFTSVAEGSSRVSFSYGGKSIEYAYMAVLFDPGGTWASGAIRVCLPGNGSSIGYAGAYYYNPPPTTGRAASGNDCKGICSFSPGCLLNNGTIQVNTAYPDPLTASFLFMYWGNQADKGKVKQQGSCVMDNLIVNLPPCINKSGGVTYIDNDHLKWGDVTLTRSSGDCQIEDNPGSNLEKVLIAKSTWVGNSCWLDEYDSKSFTFNADHTGSVFDYWDNKTLLFSWSVDDDKYLMVHGDENELNGSDKLVVISYTDNTIIIDSVYEAEFEHHYPNGNYEHSDANTTTFTNCTAQWDGQ